MQDPLAFAQQNTTRITQLLNVADLALLPFNKVQADLSIKVQADLKAALEADDPWKRYWGLIACSVFGDEAMDFKNLF